MRVHLTTEEVYQQLHAAISAIARECDGAHSKDGVGFNGHDTKFGRRIAEMNPGEWTHEIAVEASRILPTYSRQLNAAGISVNSLPLLASEEDLRHEARAQARNYEYSKNTAPYIIIDDKETRLFDDIEKKIVPVTLIRVMNSYPLKDQLRKNHFQWARQGTKTWDAPLSPRSASTIIGLPEIRLTDEQRELLQPLADSFDPESIPEAEKDFNFKVSPENPEKLWLSSDYGVPPIQILRALPGRTWRGKERVNEVNAHPGLIKMAEQYGLTFSPAALEAIEAKRAEWEEEKAAVNAIVALSKSETTDVAVAIQGELYEFQRAGVAASLMYRNVRGQIAPLIGDAPGLGKTRQALSLAETLAEKGEKAFPLLVVCPPNLKLNWYKEIQALLPHRSITVYFGKGNPADKGTMKSDILIIGYPSLYSYLDYLPELGGIVFDESQYIKNERASRTKAARIVCGSGFDDSGYPIPGALAEDGFVACLTGTPILNRPIELVQQLLCLGHLNSRRGGPDSVGWFKYTFCGPKGTKGRMSFSGVSNELVLHEWLRTHCMIRREKMDVLKDLPPKTRAPLFIGLSGSSKSYFDKLAKIAAERAAESRAQAIVQMNLLRQAVGKAKVDQALEWIFDFLETGKQLIVFATHKEVQRNLIETLEEGTSEYPSYKVARILGAQKDVEEQKAKFQSGECPVIVLSFDAAREGHTLTAASDVLFVQMGWNPATHDQAEDRAHRIGQDLPVTAWWMVAQDVPIDIWLWELIGDKRTSIDAVTSGVTPDEKEASIFNQVLERTFEKYNVPAPKWFKGKDND